MNVGEVIENYLKLRDKKRKLEDMHKEILAPYNDAMRKIENALAVVMEESGLDNLPGGGGTAYKTVRSTVSVSDWDTFFKWVQENDAWHMLEHRAAKIAVEETLDETKELPPGLSINRVMAVNIRRS